MEGDVAQMRFLRYFMRTSNTVILNQGLFCSPGDVWQCLETFLLSQRGERVLRHLVGRGSDAINILHGA